MCIGGERGFLSNREIDSIILFGAVKQLGGGLRVSKRSKELVHTVH